MSSSQNPPVASSSEPPAARPNVEKIGFRPLNVSRREPDPGGVVLTMSSAERMRRFEPLRYSLMSRMSSPRPGIAAASVSCMPRAAARCWLMSASMATTGRPCDVRRRQKSEASVVFPLPPFPTKAMRISLAGSAQPEELERVSQYRESRLLGDRLLLRVEVAVEVDVDDRVAADANDVMVMTFVLQFVARRPVAEGDLLDESLPGEESDLAVERG